MSPEGWEVSVRRLPSFALAATVGTAPALPAGECGEVTVALIPTLPPQNSTPETRKGLAAMPMRAFFALLTAFMLWAGPAQAAPPNIVLLISDDQAWTDYGFMGHPTIQTPRLDRLARESLTFTRGYVPDSLCRPSLTTIATGLYPHQHGSWGTIRRRRPIW